jgi:hypothetical protein
MICSMLPTKQRGDASTSSTLLPVALTKIGGVIQKRNDLLGRLTPIVGHADHAIEHMQFQCGEALASRIANPADLLSHGLATEGLLQIFLLTVRRLYL